METNAFASLAVFKLPSTYRLLASSCCPDKDLIVLVSRIGGKDRISLWKIQGSKKWEVDVGTDENRSEEVVDLTWSPDGIMVFLPSSACSDVLSLGQSIAVAHDPPRITLHSIQDGREERRLSVGIQLNAQRRSCHVTGMWWFREEKLSANGSIPDIFRRGAVIVRAPCPNTTQRYHYLTELRVIRLERLTQSSKLYLYSTIFRSTLTNRR
jgi:anaphase-promoting complex subunit 4